MTVLTLTVDSRRGWGDWTGKDQANPWHAVSEAAATISIYGGPVCYSRCWHSTCSQS